MKPVNRPAGEQDEVGRAAVADLGHGAAGEHEHGGLRGLLFQGLHARLLPDEAGHEGAGGAHGGDRPRARHRPGHGPAFSIKGIGAKECGGQCNIPDGEVFMPGEGVGRGRRAVQRADRLPRRVLRQHPPRLQEGAGSSRRPRTTRPSSTRSWTATRAPATSASSPSASTRTSSSRCATSSSTRRSRARSTSRPGQAYEDCGNGNKSQVHWDMVCIQRPEYGGGEIRFDGRLIRKDGLFLPKALQKLNPDVPAGGLSLIISTNTDSLM